MEQGWQIKKETKCIKIWQKLAAIKKKDSKFSKDAVKHQMLKKKKAFPDNELRKIILGVWIVQACWMMINKPHEKNKNRIFKKQLALSESDKSAY